MKRCRNTKVRFVSILRIDWRSSGPDVHGYSTTEYGMYWTLCIVLGSIVFLLFFCCSLSFSSSIIIWLLYQWLDVCDQTSINIFPFVCTNQYRWCVRTGSHLATGLLSTPRVSRIGRPGAVDAEDQVLQIWEGEFCYRISIPKAFRRT